MATCAGLNSPEEFVDLATGAGPPGRRASWEAIARRQRAVRRGAGASGGGGAGALQRAELAADPLAHRGGRQRLAGLGAHVAGAGARGDRVADRALDQVGLGRQAE
jgi:hypothetical protein